MPPHLISVIKRMNTDLQVTFNLNGEPVAVPCTGGNLLTQALLRSMRI